MEFIVGILGNLISDLISSSTSFLIGHLTDNITWKTWKAKHQLSKNQSDFLDRYAEALVALKKSEKPGVLIRFFGEESVIRLIHDHWYGTIDETAFDKNFKNLTHWFTLEKQLNGFSAEQEIAFFLKCFGETVHENRTAGEAQVFRMIVKILEELQGGQSTSVPKNLTRIPAIDLKNEFIGREQDLQQLKEKLETASKVVLVNGLGGIGKTVLATAYIQTYSGEYDHLAWINRGEDLMNAFVFNTELADTLGLPFQKDEDPNDRFRNILWTMQQLPGHNLLIIDNAQEQAGSREIREQLPGPPNWQVLLTSRLELQGFDRMRLDTLHPEAAKELFRTHFQGFYKEAELEELLTEIGYHTLTVELLARLLNKLNNVLSLPELTATLREKHLDDPELQEKVWARHSGEERGIYLHLMKAFELSKLSDREQWLLKQFVVLPVEQYTVAILADFLKDPPLALNAILNSLVGKGWLTLHDDKTFSIHRLIQKVVEYQLEPCFEDTKSLVKSMIEKMSVDAYTSRLMVTVSWINYAIALENYFATFHNYLIATLQDVIGLTFSDLGKYSEALTYSQKAMIVREEILAPNDPVLAISYNNIAVNYRDMGQFDRALDYHQKTLAIFETVLASNHPSLAISYDNIGITYRAMGRYDQSLTYHLKALEINAEVLEANHPDLAISYNNIGEAYRDLGRYKQALDYHLKALEISEEVLEANHPDLAISFNNIGETYRALGLYEQALSYHKKALAIKDGVLSANHPDFANSYNNIGETYRALGQFELALFYLKRALVPLKEILEGNDHPYLATSYNNIGLTYCDMGQYEQGLKYLNKALVILEKVLEVDHPDLAKTYTNIADAYRDLGLYGKALGYYKKALIIWEELEGANATDLAISFNNMAEIYHTLGQNEQTLYYLKKAQVILETTLEANHPSLAISYKNIALTYRALGQNDKAEKYEAKATAIRKVNEGKK